MSKQVLTLVSSFSPYSIHLFLFLRQFVQQTALFFSLSRENGIILHMLELTWQNLPPLFSSLVFLLMGWLVFRKNIKSRVNLLFLLLCLVTFWWQFSWFVLF
jgi:hypothetical protein